MGCYDYFVGDFIVLFLGILLFFSWGCHGYFLGDSMIVWLGILWLCSCGFYHYFLGDFMIIFFGISWLFTWGFHDYFVGDFREFKVYLEWHFLLHKYVRLHIKQEIPFGLGSISSYNESYLIYFCSVGPFSALSLT